MVGIPIGIASSSVALKFYVVTEGIKKCKSIIKKKRKKHDRIVLLSKIKLNTKGVLISKALINPEVGHDEFASMNNLLRKYNDMKEAIKNPKSSKSENLKT